jgi:hypothetical protein
MTIGELIMFGDNVGVVFDGEPATPDVTVRSVVELGNTPVAAIPAPPEESYLPPEVTVYPIPQAPPAYVEPETPIEMPRKPVNTWLLAGCGCLIVILLLGIAVFIFIDQPWISGGGLYCRSPFDLIFETLGFCP